MSIPFISKQIELVEAGDDCNDIISIRPAVEYLPLMGIENMKLLNGKRVLVIGAGASNLAREMEDKGMDSSGVVDIDLQFSPIDPDTKTQGMSEEEAKKVAKQMVGNCKAVKIGMLEVE